MKDTIWRPKFKHGPCSYLFMKKGLGLELWCLAPLLTISAVSWRSVLLVEENRVPGENHRSAASHLKRYHITLDRLHVHRHDRN